MKMIQIHKTCPYYDEKYHKCGRSGCHLLTPCILYNTRLFKQSIRNKNEK